MWDGKKVVLFMVSSVLLPLVDRYQKSITFAQLTPDEEIRMCGHFLQTQMQLTNLRTVHVDSLH